MNNALHRIYKYRHGVGAIIAEVTAFVYKMSNNNMARKYVYFVYGIKNGSNIWKRDYKIKFKVVNTELGERVYSVVQNHLSSCLKPEHLSEQ
jgi:hypothetical protein